VSAPPLVAARRIDAFLPRYHFSEIHDIRVRASRRQTWEAIQRVTAREIRFFTTLMAIRSLPALLAGRVRPDGALARPILEVAMRSGFVLLAETPPDELVVGTIGQFWRPTGPRLPLAGPDEFLAFDTPGYARCAMDFRLEEHAPGETRVITETRIFTPEAGVRRRFGAYWLIVHPGSAFIRRMWLAAIRRRAERRS
jgi:hypothetical protein